MAQTDALTVLDNSMQLWELMTKQADVFIRSGLLPAHIKSPEAAIVIMMKGRELGLPPLYALSTIGVIGGKPVIASEAMANLIYQRHGDNALHFAESTDACCTIDYRRKGWDKAQRYSFTIADATKAGLANGAVWSKYPAAMLRARCVSAVARMAYPDVIAGCYTEEEAQEIQERGTSVIEGTAESIRILQHATNGHDRQVDTTTGEVTQADDSALPAPMKWITDLRQMASQLFATTTTRIEVVEPMTRAEALTLKASLVEALAAAEDARHTAAAGDLAEVVL